MKILTVSIALLHREGRWLFQRRALDSAHLPGLWEFPGGKAEAGESPEQALRRELLEELSWEPSELRSLGALSHPYDDLLVLIHPFVAQGPELPRTSLAWGWFTASEAARLPTPKANRSLLDLLGQLP